MAKRKGFYADAEPAASEQQMERNVASLLQAKRAQIMDVSITHIRPNPFQARRSFPDIDGLAQTIQAQGFTSRLRVRPLVGEPGWYQLVFGERRLRAAQLAGLYAVPCEIADHTDAEMIEIGLAENIQRRDLDPLEEAQAFRTFIAERGYTIRSLAERIGKDKSYVEERLALLRTPADVQAMLVQRPDTIRVAREIAKLPDAAARAALITEVISGERSAQSVRQAVKAQLGGAERGAAPSLAAEIAAVRGTFARWAGAAVTLPAEERQALNAYLAEHVAQLAAPGQSPARRVAPWCRAVRRPPRQSMTHWLALVISL